MKQSCGLLFSEEITYLMMCTDVNNDGKVDYMEFTERFHNPARDIGKVLLLWSSEALCRTDSSVRLFFCFMLLH